ncbi:hypothetical protein ASG01_10760 [Chryseobacterium sp. Leaf180]|nr:hypothetical protein ASG01_10760 [Chryseobacterium sp. Leaf180]
MINLFSAQIPETVREELSELQKLEKRISDKKIPDTARINILRKICREYIDLDNKKLAQNAQKMLQISERAKNIPGKADALNFLGVVEDINSNYSKALRFYTESLKLLKNTDNAKSVASVSNNIGLLEWKIGNYKNALSIFFFALKYAEKSGSNKIQGNISSNIGLVWQDLKRYKEALVWQKKALAFRKKEKNDNGIASTYNNLANAFSFLNEHDSTLYFQEKAIDLQVKTGDDYGLAISYMNRGEEYSKNKNDKQAFDLYEKSRIIREKIGDELGLSFTYESLSNCYSKLGNLQNAVFFGEKAYAISKKINSNERISESSRNLAEIYEKAGDQQKALKLYKIANEFQDKIFNSEMVDKVAFLNVKYETEKKEKDLNLAKLNISKATLASKQKNLSLIILSSLVAIGLLAFRIFSVKTKLRQKQLLLENDLLQQQSISKTQQQRLEISRDLHDSLGAHLTLMSATLDGLKNAENTDVRVKEKINSLSDFVDGSIFELKNTLWVLHSETVFLQDLRLKILNLINSISEVKPDLKIKIDFDVNENILLDSKMAAQIFRVVQEILNNALKHSGANLIELNFTQNAGDLLINISDNGVGFDTEIQRNKSFGLTNIETRIHDISGTVHLESGVGSGTVYKLQIPLQ